MESTIRKQCPKCKSEVSEMALFCSNCGYSLKSRLEDTSILKQILVYFVSFFLAPFGLGYAFKYLKQSDKKSKIIGIISLILTFFAIITVISIAKKYLEQEYGFLDLINDGGL
jgi:predicted amidophosphoribosyltransferase